MMVRKASSPLVSKTAVVPALYGIAIPPSITKLASKLNDLTVMDLQKPLELMLDEYNRVPFRITSLIE